MATHSINLGGKIPWREESGGLQFMGSLQVRHDWACTYAWEQGERGKKYLRFFLLPPSNFQPTWKPEDMGTKVVSLRGLLRLDQSKAEGRGMAVTVVGGGWPMRVTSTILSTHVTVLEDFNSSTSLKYLLLFTGQCVSAYAQTHTYTRVCVRKYMYVFAEYPPVSSWSLILTNLRDGIIFKAGNRWYLRESLQIMSPLHFLCSSALFCLKKERRATKVYSQRTILSILNCFSQTSKFLFISYFCFIDLFLIHKKLHFYSYHYNLVMFYSLLVKWRAEVHGAKSQTQLIVWTMTSKMIFRKY